MSRDKWAKCGVEGSCPIGHQMDSAWLQRLMGPSYRFNRLGDRPSIAVLLRDHRRLASKFEALAAANILASHHVVFAHHVRPEFREASAVSLVGAARKLPFLGTHHPGDFIFSRLVTMRTVQRSRFLLLLLVKKVALFHNFGRRIPDQQ